DLEAPLRGGRFDRGCRQRGCRPCQPVAGGVCTDPRARASSGQEDDGGGNPPSGPGDRKKKSVLAQRVRAVTGHPVTAICRLLGMARQTAYHVLRPRRAGFYHRADDETVIQQIRAVTNSRATYGYRRVWAMVNRT